MYALRWITLFLFISLFGHEAESQIIVIENFISKKTAKELIQFYDVNKKNLSRSSDNQLTFDSSTSGHIRNTISQISHEILKVMQNRYGIDDRYHIDHLALYARIKGNYCPYHADNVLFTCPIHGSDQTRLRQVCNGSCPGSHFLPNHTGWREYTALVYLNDDFEGGEIAFEDGPHNQIYKKVIPIRSCMLVIAPNGPNFYHEVYPIKKGKRYSLHIWYTSNPNYYNFIQ